MTETLLIRIHGIYFLMWNFLYKQPTGTISYSVNSEDLSFFIIESGAKASHLPSLEKKKLSINKKQKLFSKKCETVSCYREYNIYVLYSSLTSRTFYEE